MRLWTGYPPKTFLCKLVVVCSLLLLVSCGRSSSSSSGDSSGGEVSGVSVSGPSDVQAGLCSNFTATVSGTGNYDHAVQWYVNGTEGGSAGDGLISSAGAYCAPPQIPVNNDIQIKAVSNGNSNESATTVTRVVQIAITPAQVQLYTGGTEQFSASVTGAANSSVTWQVNGVAGGTPATGTISSIGLYTAPSQMTNTAIAVEAALTEALSVYAGANIDLSQQIVLSPQNPTLAYGTTQQFSATINGIATQVSWAANYGSISSSGLYTATATQSPDTIRAFTGNANGSTTVQIHGVTPAITSISPQPATALQQISIVGSNLNGLATVVFSDAIGGQLPVTGTGVTMNPDGTGLTVNVPQGAVSGPVYVFTQQGTLSPVQSNKLQFKRLARLRIRTPEKDLSAGELVTLQYALMGDSTPQTVSFTADVGSFSGATYSAPGAVGSDSFAHIKGCITGTNSCDTLTIQLHPFRITPDVPVVSLGQSLQLSADLGSTSAGATWSLSAGGGSLNSNGLYTAGSAVQSGGPALIAGTYSGAKEQTSVGVTGAFPGLLNRIYDYVDEHDANATGSFVCGMAVNGSRLYVATSNHEGAFNDSYFWIDIYDVSDPLHPAWITAVESNSSGPLFLTGSYLYSYTNTDLAVPGFPNTITVYSIQSGLPVLTARTQIPQIWTMDSSQGTIAVVPYPNGPDTNTSGEVVLYDVSTGTIATTDLQIPLPSDANSLLFDSTIRVGNRLFASTLHNDGLTGALLTYDLSTSPPTLLGETDGRSVKFFASGNLLFGANGGMDIYDISSQLPQLQSHVGGINAEELNGTKLLGYTGQQGGQIVDLTDPQNPKVTAVLFDGLIAGFNWSTMLGNYVYAAEADGGIVIYDAFQSGGPVVQNFLYAGPHLMMEAYDLLPQSPYLYAATTSTQDGAVLVVYDASTSDIQRIGEYVDGNQAGDAVEASGNYVYFGMTANTAVLDVSIPASPRLVATLPIATTSLARAGNILFASTYNNALAVLNISNPASPVIVKTISLPGLAVKLRVVGNLLFVADGGSGLFVYDITSPTAPVRLSQVTGFAGVNDVAVAGTTAFLAADVDGVGILDISNPSAPVLLSKTSLSRIDPFSYDNPLNEAISIGVSHGLVYAGTLADNGLVFGLDYTNLNAPRIVSAYAYGAFIQTSTRSLAFSGNQLLVAGLLNSGVYPIAQVDLSNPFDMINQYFPPQALQSPAALGQVRKLSTRVARRYVPNISRFLPYPRTEVPRSIRGPR